MEGARSAYQERIAQSYPPGLDKIKAKQALYKRSGEYVFLLKKWDRVFYRVTMGFTFVAPVIISYYVYKIATGTMTKKGE